MTTEAQVLRSLNRRRRATDNQQPPTMKQDFFKFNFAHIVIIATWLISFAFGYGSLSNRVTTNEGVLLRIQADKTALSDRTLDDQKRLVAEIANLSSKLSTIGNDVEWLKKNVK